MATATINDTIRANDSFRPIPQALLDLTHPSGISLYGVRQSDEEPTLLCKLGQSLGEQQREELKTRYQTLFVQKQDFSQLSQQLLFEVDAVVGNKTIASEVRMALLQIGYAEELERTFRRSSLSEYVRLSQELGNKISTLLQQDTVSIPALYYQLHHNGSHYAHVTNVAAYAVVLAQALQLADSEQLAQIATGCLLHETGNLFLTSKKLLTQSGRLSASEQQELEKLPQLAYEALFEFKDLSFGQLMMAYQQFERIDGTGYPVRYLAEDIHPWAKLLTVVNEFDLMSGNRDCCTAEQLRNVLIHLSQRTKTQFAPEIVQCLITNFQSQ